jgi:hypothetical protein
LNSNYIHKTKYAKQEDGEQKKGRYLPAEKLLRPREMKIPDASKMEARFLKVNIRERSNLSLLRRPSASCGVSLLGGPAAVEATADSGRDEGKARKKGDSTDPLERVRQKVLLKDPLKRPFHRKKRRPLR